MNLHPPASFPAAALLGAALLPGSALFPPQDNGVAPRQQPMPSPEAVEMLPFTGDFPAEGPSPAGQVSLKDVRFAPPILPAFTGPFHGLEVRYVRPGEIALAEPDAKEILWRGPAAGATLIEELVAGVHTVRKELPGGGQRLWTEAGKYIPDLLFQKEKGRTSRLLDRNGRTLWSGVLAEPAHPVLTRTEGTPYQLNASGVNIDGTDTLFTVKNACDDSVLWSGQVPRDPVLLIRDGHEFALQSADHSHGGWDGITRLRFAVGAGTVTVSDGTGKLLGTLPIVILKAHCAEETYNGQSPDRLKARRAYITYATPDATLARVGTIFLTYKDATGRVLRRAKAYRTQSGTGRRN